MAKHKSLVWVFFVILCVCAAFLWTTSRTQSQHAVQKQQAKSPVIGEKLDTSNFPILDYPATGPIDPKERAKRQNKGKKYNSRYTPPIDEARDQINATTDWEVGLSALPIDKSVAVILSRITDAKTYFSENQTNVYSEFEVRIEKVFKNEEGNLSVGSSVLVERAGGRVRFPSGKMMVSVVSHQQMPHIGKQYLLFLTHDGPFGGVHEDLFILTGYELRGDSVYPLDKLIPGHPITSYNGVEKSSFFHDLDAALNVAGLATR